MPHRLVALLRSCPRPTLRLPAGTSKVALSVLAFAVSSLVVAGALMAWAAVKAYLLCERLAWQAAKRMSGF
jgi:hypothetical protein